METGDYVYRFRLDLQNGNGQDAHSDALAEMVRSQLEALLDVVLVFEGDRTVTITAFSFMSAPAKKYSLYPERSEQDISGMDKHDPPADASSGPSGEPSDLKKEILAQDPVT